MSENPKPNVIKTPGQKPIPYVVVKLADGKIVLRHPDEVKKK